MSKFIKLTRLIININYIHSIDIKPNKYYINITSNKFDGSTWSAGGFGYGSISSNNYGIQVCETKNSIDYKIVSDWIDNH
mgnify:CR=1 FL=1|tara:strand:+ start:1009 stop:1248 length:240 start_codon:yes stop_codon:yes gene_type:complete